MTAGRTGPVAVTVPSPKRKHRESEDYPVLSGGEKHYELRPQAVIRMLST